MRSSNLPEGDDGRTIVNMNVEGMPWYEHNEKEHRLLRAARGKKPPELIDGRDFARFTCSALAAGLLVALVFSAGMILFVLFCVYVWFR